MLGKLFSECDVHLCRDESFMRLTYPGKRRSTTCTVSLPGTMLRNAKLPGMMRRVSLRSFTSKASILTMYKNRSKGRLPSVSCFSAGVAPATFSVVTPKMYSSPYKQMRTSVAP